MIPVGVQWMKTISDAISSIFYYFWLFVTLLLLFRPYQLKGLRKTLFLVCSVAYCLDAGYRLVLQKAGVWYYMAQKVYQTPLYLFFFVSISIQLYVVGKPFCARSTKMLLSLMCKMIVPFCLPIICGIFTSDVVYGVYIKQTNKRRKASNCSLSPSYWTGCENCITNLCSAVMEHYLSGYSYVLLTPMYFGTPIRLGLLSTLTANQTTDSKCVSSE